MHASLSKTVRMGALLVVVFLLAGLVMPKWLLFLSTMALSHGMVSLGIVIQMRSGVVSFGQGFVFAAGGYATALAANHLGITDAILMVLVGGLAATLCALPFAPLLSSVKRILRCSRRQRHPSDFALIFGCFFSPPSPCRIRAGRSSFPHGMRLRMGQWAWRRSLC